MFHLSDLRNPQLAPYELVFVSIVGLIAAVIGVYMLWGHNWARWLAMAWIAFHVVVSAFHSLTEFAMHGLIFALFVYALFQSESAKYFSRRPRNDSGPSA